MFIPSDAALVEPDDGVVAAPLRWAAPIVAVIFAVAHLSDTGTALLSVLSCVTLGMLPASLLGCPGQRVRLQGCNALELGLSWLPGRQPSAPSRSVADCSWGAPARALPRIVA